MNQYSTKGSAPSGLFAGAAWSDPVEAGIRGRIRGLIQESLEEELATVQDRDR